MRWFVFTVVLALAACQSSAQRAQIRADADRKTCIELGLTVGSDAYANCWLTLQQTHAQEDAAIRDRATSHRAPPVVNPRILRPFILRP